MTSNDATIAMMRDILHTATVELVALRDEIKAKDLAIEKLKQTIAELKREKLKKRRKQVAETKQSDED